MKSLALIAAVAAQTACGISILSRATQQQKPEDVVVEEEETAGIPAIYTRGEKEMTLHYLRIPKTGSSSSITMLNEAGSIHKEECKHVNVHIDHGYTAYDFAKEPKQDVGFVVLR